jgi:hypothetical protein
VASAVNPGQLVLSPVPVQAAMNNVGTTRKVNKKRRDVFIYYSLFHILQGTGSKPPGLNGLQRKTRQVAIQLPLIAPNL